MNDLSVKMIEVILPICTSIILIVAIIMLYRMNKKKQNISEMLFTSFIAPILISMILYFLFNYKIDILNKQNYSLDLDINSASITEENKDYKVAIPIKQGGILEMYLFRFVESGGVKSEKIDVDNSNRRVTFDFRSTKKANIKIDNGVKTIDYDNECSLTPGAEEFILYYKDFSGNEQYKYMVIKPEIDLRKCAYFFSVSNNEEEKSIAFPIMLDKSADIHLFDVKFIDKEGFNSQIAEITKPLEIDLSKNVENNTIEMDDGAKFQSNPKLTVRYSISNVEKIIENLKLIMNEKKYWM